MVYLLVVLAQFSYYIDFGSVKAYEIAYICVDISALFSSLMLDWVVYNLSQNTGQYAHFND